jgi:hypothetical protein
MLLYRSRELFLGVIYIYIDTHTSELTIQTKRVESNL